MLITLVKILESLLGLYNLFELGIDAGAKRVCGMVVVGLFSRGGFLWVMSWGYAACCFVVVVVGREDPDAVALVV